MSEDFSRKLELKCRVTKKGIIRKITGFFQFLVALLFVPVRYYAFLSQKYRNADKAERKMFCAIFSLFPIIYGFAVWNFIRPFPITTIINRFAPPILLWPIFSIVALIAEVVIFVLHLVFFLETMFLIV